MAAAPRNRPWSPLLALWSARFEKWVCTGRRGETANDHLWQLFGPGRRRAALPPFSAASIRRVRPPERRAQRTRVAGGAVGSPGLEPMCARAAPPGHRSGANGQSVNPGAFRADTETSCTGPIDVVRLRGNAAGPPRRRDGATGNDVAIIASSVDPAVFRRQKNAWNCGAWPRGHG